MLLFANKVYDAGLVIELLVNSAKPTYLISIENTTELNKI